MRGVCGLEAWKIQAGKTTFVVKRIKVYVGLEGLCEPDESTLLPCTGTYGTRSMGEREPTYIYIYIYIKKTYTIYNFLIKANSTKVFGAVNNTSKTKK